MSSTPEFLNLGLVGVALGSLPEIGRNARAAEGRNGRAIYQNRGMPKVEGWVDTGPSQENGSHKVIGKTKAGGGGGTGEVATVFRSRMGGEGEPPESERLLNPCGNRKN